MIAWQVVWERTEAALQQMLDDSLQAHQYYSDRFPIYANLAYHPSQRHLGLPNKSQTYTVEGVNADLRHYLARLHRKSRCFSRSLTALAQALRLFVFAYNQRQLDKLSFPRYPSNLRDFVSPQL
jgi:IS1 family transposase